MAIKYKLNNLPGITYNSSSGEELFFPIEKIRDALENANAKINTINSISPEVFEILGMRNLSAFVGEVFGRAFAEISKGAMIKNPHQDGYPDLLAMTPKGKKNWEALKNNLQDKKPFSPFPTGGIEIKATCGSVPTPTESQKKGFKKPDIGDARIDVLKGYDWKAHHRLTNHLVGVVWDFINSKPTIVGLFYSSDLTEADWGNIIQPKEGGGRTTSVSIMTRTGVAKMYNGWLAVIDDQRYFDFFNKFNKSNLIALEAEGNTLPDVAETSE
jgi:hypothetical protein